MQKLNWDNFPKEILQGPEPWMPFPGIYPTRWALDIKWGDNRRVGYTHKWRYLGKPNARVADFMQRTLNTYSAVYVLAREFVRNGVIARGLAQGPRSSFPIDGWCRSKFNLVDPWLGAQHGRMVMHWASHEMRPLPMVYKGHKFMIYAASNIVTASRLEAYKSWLDGANIDFSRL